MEEKIYKEIVEIQNRIISGIIHRAYLSHEYHKENLKELNDTVAYISNKDKWDYCGISNKEDLIKLELLQNLIKKD